MINGLTTSGEIKTLCTECLIPIFFSMLFSFQILVQNFTNKFSNITNFHFWKKKTHSSFLIHYLRSTAFCPTFLKVFINTWPALNKNWKSSGSSLVSPKASDHLKRKILKIEAFTRNKHQSFWLKNGFGSVEERK